MKRRDFLKLGAGAVAARTVAMNTVASKTATKPMVKPAVYRDWSVRFRSVTASIQKETYETFYNDGQRHT